METASLFSQLSDGYINYNVVTASPDSFLLMPTKDLVPELEELCLERIETEPVSKTGFGGSPLMEIESIEDQLSWATQNYSKGSLKLARRLSREIHALLHSSKPGLVQKFLQTGLELLRSEVLVFEVKILFEDRLARTMLSLIQHVWREFTGFLSCSRNKKISKVTKDVWDIVFDYHGFWSCIEKTKDQLDIGYCFVALDPKAVMAFELFFKKILFLVNHALTVSLLHLHLAQRKDFRENLGKVDNYLVLALVPELYDCYNHTKGVFVTECCGSCKVCGPKLKKGGFVPLKIKKAIEASQEFQTKFNFEEINPLEVVGFLAKLESSMSTYM